MDPSEVLLGRDLVLPLPGGTVSATPSGDWPTVAGRDNLQAAQIRRAIASPRSLAHRPDYGGGLERSVGAPMTPAKLAHASSMLKTNALRDPRVEDAKASLAEVGPGIVSVGLSVRQVGDQSTQITFTVGG